MKEKTMRRHYLREATVMLFVARLAVRFIPPARLFAWASRPPRRIRRFAGDEVALGVLGGRDSRRQAVDAGACLPRALAAQTMLRRRGIASKLCLGVTREGGALAAHAWVEVGQEMIVGGAAAQGFSRIAEFGHGPAREPA